MKRNNTAKQNTHRGGDGQRAADRPIDEKGKFHIEKCALAAYAHGQYFALGKKIGSFGYSVKKKKK